MVGKGWRDVGLFCEVVNKFFQKKWRVGGGASVIIPKPSSVIILGLTLSRSAISPLPGAAELGPCGFIGGRGATI
jgi:hypothetical protein